MQNNNKRNLGYIETCPSLENHRGEDGHLENTLTTPSPPPPITHRPSRLQTTEQTPSPRIRRWLVISWVQLRFSSDQNRRLASCPADTSSRPSGDEDREEIADG
jgi:hypothetical protein